MEITIIVVKLLYHIDNILINNAESPLKISLKNYIQINIHFFQKFTEDYKTQFELLNSNCINYLDWESLGLYCRYSIPQYFLYLLQYIIPKGWNKTKKFF